MQLNLLTPILLQKYLQCGKGQRVILWKQSWRSYLRGDRQWLLRTEGRGGGRGGRQLLAQHQPWETKKPPVLRQRGLGLWQRVLVCQCVYCLLSGHCVTVYGKYLEINWLVSKINVFLCTAATVSVTATGLRWADNMPCNVITSNIIYGVVWSLNET